MRVSRPATIDKWSRIRCNISRVLMAPCSRSAGMALTMPSSAALADSANSARVKFLTVMRPPPREVNHLQKRAS